MWGRLTRCLWGRLTRHKANSSFLGQAESWCLGQIWGRLIRCIRGTLNRLLWPDCFIISGAGDKNRLFPTRNKDLPTKCPLPCPHTRKASKRSIVQGVHHTGLTSSYFSPCPFWSPLTGSPLWATSLIHSILAELEHT